jgi:autotransporter translocation and assembly factor TamB
LRWKAKVLTWWLGQWLLVLLPACLMLMAGAYYGWRVWLTAEQLLPHALRDYLRRQANLDVQMERIHLSGRRLQAWNLTIRLLDGSPLGTVRYLELRPPRGNTPMRIQLERPHLHLTRDAQGRWNIDALLRRPPRRAEVQIPFELTSTEGTLEFRDAFVRPVVRQSLRLASVRIRQPGRSMVVWAEGHSPGTGALQLTAVSDGARWRLNLAAERLRWATVAPYLPTDALRLRDGEGALQLEMLSLPNRPLRFAGVAQGTLSGARYQRTPLPWHEVQFSLYFTESFLTGQLHTRDGHLGFSGALEKHARGQGWRYAFRLRAHGADAAAIERLLMQGSRHSETRHWHATGRYSLQLQAVGSWLPRKGWRHLIAQSHAAGKVQLERLDTAQGRFEQIEVPLLLTRGRLRLLDAHATFGGGVLRVNALAHLDAAGTAFQLSALAHAIRLERLPLLRDQKLSGTVSVQLLGEGTLEKPRLMANLLSDALRYEGTPLGTLRARLHYQNQRLQIPVAILQGAIGSVQLAGSVGLEKVSTPTLDIDFGADEVDLNRLASLLGYNSGNQGGDAGKTLRLDGIAYLRGRLTGTRSHPTIRAQTAIFDGRVGDIGMELLAARVILDKHRISLPEIIVYRRTAVAQASGEVELPSEEGTRPLRFKAQGHISDFDLATLTEWSESPVKLAGLANLSFSANGTPEQFEITGELTGGKVQLDKLIADSAATPFRLTRHERETVLQLDSVQVQLREGIAQGQVQLTLQDAGTSLRAAWNAHSVPLSVLAPYLPESYHLNGVLNTQGRLEGFLDALHAESTWHLTHLNLNGVALGEATGHAAWLPQVESLLTPSLFPLPNTNCASKVHPLPPSFRFPPLREGNRAGGWLSLLREGNRAGGWLSLLREGNCAGGWLSLLCEGNHAGRTCSVPPAGRGNLQEGVLFSRFGEVWSGDWYKGGEGAGSGGMQEILLAKQRVEGAKGTLTLQAMLNAPEGRILLDTLRYTPETATIEAQGALEAIPVSWLRQLMLALPVEVPPDLPERTDTLNGTLSARWQLSGTTEKPQFAFDGQALHITWNGRSLGELQARGNWSQEQLDFQVRWQAESSRLEAKGSLQDETLNAEMELSQFPLEWLPLWEPSLPPIKGILDLTMLATGSPKQPELTLSATVQRLELPLSSPSDPSDLSGGSNASQPPTFPIDQLLFSRIEVREGAITTEDALIQVRDYRARLSGQLPFRWSSRTIPRDEPISVHLTIKEQPLRLLELFLPIDVERTAGTLNARLDIEGTLDELKPRGELQIAQGSLALESLSTYLHELGLQVEFDGQQARIVQAQARSSAGGQLDLTGAIDVAREEPVLALSGRLQRFTLNEPRLPMGGSARGHLDGEFSLRGTLKKPQLAAHLKVLDGFLSLPAEMQMAQGGFALPANPELNVQIQVAPGFTLRNPNLDARMEGALQISGTLGEPRASGTFSLQGGALNLPTARLRLQPESLILLTYPHTTPTGETIARLELDVRATTTVVALDYTGDPQRYRVELDIRGPLDDPQRFQMVARSDPPGLSEQRILSLLGRGSALEALARGDNPVQIFRQQLSEVVAGQVMPALLSPLETGIAEALGLEQFALDLDYTGNTPAQIYLVKELFNGFGISYRRSLAITNPPYEVRLFYRLPFRYRFLQRLKIGWGFDNTQRQFLFIEGSLLFR